MTVWNLNICFAECTLSNCASVRRSSGLGNCVNKTGKNTKNSRLSWGDKDTKNSSYGAAAGEKFSGCLGGLVAQLRCPVDDVGRVCSYIQDESNNDNDNIDHEQRELYWFCFEWSSGVLYTRSWSARREWGERTSFTLHTMGKTQKLVE